MQILLLVALAATVFADDESYSPGVHKFIEEVSVSSFKLVLMSFVV